MQPTIHKIQRWTNRIADLTGFSRRYINALAQTFGNSRLSLHASGKMRRFALVHFRKEFVYQQLLIRQGACRQCGACCNLLLTCPMLNLQGDCIAYGKCRPQACKTFPIDKRDIDEIKLANGRCGFNFSGKSIDCHQTAGRA